MKIGILGAQGTGKTTLAEALAKELGYPFIREVAREVMGEMGVISPRELKGSPEKGRKFQMACLYRQIAEEEKHKNFVCDRTTIDSAAYWIKWHAHENSSQTNMRYYTLAWENAKKYDLLVYVPPEFPLVDDGCRSIDKSYQREIDMLVRLFLHTWSERFITVHGSLEERVAQVVKEVHHEIISTN
mgnify:FL=1